MMIKKIMYETVPTTIYSVFRNRRRSFAMLSGIMLSMIILSGIFIFNDQLKQDNYQTLIGDIPFEVRFDILSEPEDYNNMLKLKTEIEENPKVLDTEIIGGTNSNEQNNMMEVLFARSANISSITEIESVITDISVRVTPFFIDHTFFNGLIGENLFNRGFEGETDLFGNSVIVPRIVARELDLFIGDRINATVFLQTVFGVVNTVNYGILPDLQIIGVYDSEGIDFTTINFGGDSFLGHHIFLSLDLLQTAPTMINFHEAMLKTGNFYVAAKINPLEFNVGSPTEFNSELSQFINQITRDSQFDIQGHNIIVGALIGFEIISIFITILYVIIGIPVVFLSFYLLNFGLELALEERRREIAIKKMQGASSKQIFSDLKNDSILILSLGSILGYGLGMIAAWIISSSIGFMIIDLQQTSLLTFIQWNPFAFFFPFIIITIAVIITTYRKGRKFVDQEVTEGVARMDVTEVGFLKRSKLDIFFLLIGISGFTLVILNNMRISTGLNPVLEVLIYLFSPFFLWIGGAVFGSRVTKFVPMKLEGIFLNIPVFKDVKRIIKSGLRRRGDIDRLAIIIILTLSISTLSAIQGTTEEQLAVTNIEWQIGADYRIQFDNPGLHSSSILDVNGLDHSVGISTTTARILSSGVTLLAFENSKLLNYMNENNDFIYWQRDNFIDMSAKQAIETINENPYSIFIPFNLLFELNVDIGSRIILKIAYVTPDATEIISLSNIEVAGIVNQLPGGFVGSILVSEQLMNEVIAIQKGKERFDYENLPMNSTTYLVNSNLRFSLNENQQRDIENQLVNIQGMTEFRSLSKELSEINTRTSGYGVTGLLSMNFMVSIAAVLISAFAFSAILIEKRKQEFATLRAIGAQKSQIYKLALGENTLMMATASIWGIFIGIGISYLFNGVFEFLGFFIGTNVSLTRYVIIPVDQLIIIGIVTLLGMLIATMLSIRSAANQDLSLATRVV
jgi:cell division protein FtsX